MKKYKLNSSLLILLAIAVTLSLLSGLSGCNFIGGSNIENITETDPQSAKSIDKINISNISNISTKDKTDKTDKTSNLNNTQNSEDITPIDYISKSDLSVQPKKTRTILIYMNGSDLESEYEAATWDLYEMLDSQFDEKNINVIIFTGGAKRWHTLGIPNNINALFKIENGSLVKLAQIGKDPMGYPEVLAGFINFGCNLFPADKYGLIFWNHGGGAIVGYGSDERYTRNPNKAMMKLSEIDAALGSSDLYKNDKKFDFIGFDTCLMATLEMACIAQKYADYMTASEELEPEPGWDYYFMRDIKPEHSGKEIGKLIVDYYEDFYAGSEIEDITTMSLTDLSKIQAAADAFEKLAISAKQELTNGNYSYISKARSRSRMFGSRGEHAGETDMIDAGNLAKSLRKLLPSDSKALISALNRAVIYKHEGNIEELGGLSVYFPFSNKKDLNYSMDVYKSINQLPEYTDFINDFSNILDSAPFADYRSVASTVINNARISQLYEENNSGEMKGKYDIYLTPEQIENLSVIHQTVWKKIDNEYIQIEEDKNISASDDGKISMNFNDACTTLNGRLACLYELYRFEEDNTHENRRRYAIPVTLNGENADLIVIYSNSYPDGKIIGAVPTGADTYNMLDKKIVKLREGDKIQILYYTESFGEYNNKELESTEVSDGKRELWQKGEEFTVSSDMNELVLQKEPLQDGEYLCGINFIDIQQNKYYSNFLKIS